jgi:hypothetical protein
MQVEISNAATSISHIVKCIIGEKSSIIQVASWFA